MAKVLVTEDYLEDIADAIRGKNGSIATYKPEDMAQAIEDLDNYPEPTGTKAISANGLVSVKDYEFANVNVESSFTPSDEGKVVSNGELVAQTSVEKTANGTYDTTLNNEVVVNVSGGSVPRLYLADPSIVPDLLNSGTGDTLSYGAKGRSSIPYVYKVKNGNTSAIFGAYGGTRNDSPYCVYRNGMEVAGFIIAHKVAGATYQKLCIECEVASYTSGGWRQSCAVLTNSLASISSDGIVSGSKTVYLASQDKTSAQINAQTGVVINSTSPYTLDKQTVEIDISGISTDFYVGFWNCDTNLYVYSVYVE